MLTEIMAPTEIYIGSSGYLGHRGWVLIDWILTGACCGGMMGDFVGGEVLLFYY